MNDYIDRQVAIEHYQHVCRRTNCKECPLHTQVTDTLTDCELELFLHNLPSAEPTLYGYNIEHLCFIATLLQKENIPPKELKAMLSDIERMTHIIVDNITDTIQREIERSLSWK